MTSPFRLHATALGLAAFVTLSLMASIDQLATSAAPGAAMARADSAPLQVVVVTARRSQT
jgi:hypothetical protein